MTIIGVDPHPGHHAVAALEESGRPLAMSTFANSPQGLEECLTWLGQFPQPRLAVEGPTQPFFLTWLTRILAQGLTVVPVPPQLVSGARRRQSRGKSDPQDSIHIAQALLAHPKLPPLCLPAWLLPLREMVRTRLALAGQLQATRKRWRAAREELVRGCLERLVQTLEQEVATLDKAIAQRVKAVAPRLLRVRGVGPVVAGVVLAEVGDPQRFAGEDALARYCGAAPLLWQSGNSSVVRVNPGGNRRLNWALHIVALTRTRIDPRTRDFFQRKVAQGKGQRGAFRILKTYIAREIYNELRSIAAPDNYMMVQVP